MNINPMRLENETFAEYKDRRSRCNKVIKRYLNGRKVKHTKKELESMLCR